MRNPAFAVAEFEALYRDKVDQHQAAMARPKSPEGRADSSRSLFAVQFVHGCADVNGFCAKARTPSPAEEVPNNCCNALQSNMDQLTSDPV